jgi:Ca-activated chloride channel homolog
MFLMSMAMPAFAAPPHDGSPAREVGPSLAPVNTSVFDDDERELLLVLDSSGSMKEPDRSGSTKIAAAKRALHAVVAELPGDARVGMRVYGATVFSKSDPGACTDSQLVVPIGPVDKPALRREIGKYRPYGETPIAYSLKQAAKDLGGDGQRTILLVSDGEETCDPDPCGVARQLRERGIDLRIDVVGMSVSGAARQQLECIADAGGGTYCESGDAGELTSCLDHAALRAFRPFSLSGTPVDGGLRPTEAPEIGPGQYVDTLGGQADPDGTKYYRIPHAPRSTLHLGFTAWPPYHGGMIGVQDAAELTVTTPSGARCASWTVQQTVAVVRGLMADGLTVPDEFAEPGCAVAEQLLLKVQRTSPAPPHGRARFELVVVDEPAVATRSELPGPAGTEPSYEPPVPMSGPRGRVAGGAAFADAATLRPGTWTDSLQPGEVLFYRVSADWGQAAATTFRLGPDETAGDYLGTVGVGVTVDSYGPVRHRLITRASGVNELLESRPQEVTVRLPPVRYRNRDVDHQMAGISTAGYYYFSISMEQTTGSRFQVPMQISVGVDGEPTGEPEYVEADVVETPESSPTPPESESDSESSAGPSDSGDGTDVMVPVAAGVTAAGLALGAVAFTLHRRRGRSDLPSRR